MRRRCSALIVNEMSRCEGESWGEAFSGRRMKSSRFFERRGTSPQDSANKVVLVNERYLI